jgi:hypothetical protein
VGIGRVTIIVHDPAAGVNMFYRGAAIHHLFVSDRTRVGDVMRIPCNAVPPDRGWRVNPKSKPVSDRQKRGEAEQLQEWQ